MNNIYIVKKNIDKIRRGGYTCFLNPNIYKQISYRLKNDEYHIYRVYKDCDKVILYTNILPKVRLLQIDSYFPITHSDILGSLFSLNISDEVFGDIIIDNGRYYFYVIDEIGDFILNNLVMIGNKNVKVREIDVNYLREYRRKYDDKETIVSSLRIDTVIAKIIGSSRDKIKVLIKNRDVIVNYDIVNNNSYVLKDGDVFSIRKFGKYKFIKVRQMTKKDNYIIQYCKYL